MAGSFFYSSTPAQSPISTGPMIYRVPSYLLPSSAPGTPGAGAGCGGGGYGSGSGGGVGSTTAPNTTPAAPIGASSGITSPQPSNIGGFLGFLNGPRVGIGFPDGGTPVPGPTNIGAQSSQQSGGIIGGRASRGGGQGFFGFVVPPGPTGAIFQVLVVGFLAYAVFKALE